MSSKSTPIEPSVPAVASAQSKILPGQTIGIVGGGQLGQMIAFSAKAMGFKVGVLDPTPNCPCAQVCDWHIVADYHDQRALSELADRCDVLTYEFENVDAETLDAVSDRVLIPQGTRLLRITQDRLAEKQYLTSLGISVAPYAPITCVAQLEEAISEIGLPSILKTTRGGYDGKGQIVLGNKPGDDSELALKTAREMCATVPCVLETKINFDLEISVLIAGNSTHPGNNTGNNPSDSADNSNSDYVTLPIGENIHRSNILHATVVPARIPEQLKERAASLALQIARGIDLAGVLAVEMFVAGDEIYVNELAPRPHNSGHFSIEACDFSQFDLHVLGVCGWKLSQPRLLAPAVMVNVLGENLAAAEQLTNEHPNWHFHFYGKSGAKPGRKMGHITVLWEEPDTLTQLFT